MARKRPDDSKPWFAPGLKFTCTQCGDCCTGEPGFIWVDDAEIKAIAEYRGVTVGEVRYQDSKIIGDQVSLREHANGDCVYLDPKTRGCTIYPVRPIQCRTWPFWNSNLESPEAWESVCEVCPGAGQGTFVPLEKIQQLAAEREV